MPIYEYECFMCGEFEALAKWDEHMKECPECYALAPRVSRYRTFGIVYDKDMYNGRKAKDV